AEAVEAEMGISWAASELCRRALACEAEAEALMRSDLGIGATSIEILKGFFLQCSTIRVCLFSTTRLLPPPGVASGSADVLAEMEAVEAELQLRLVDWQMEHPGAADVSIGRGDADAAGGADGWDGSEAGCRGSEVAALARRVLDGPRDQPLRSWSESVLQRCLRLPLQTPPRFFCCAPAAGVEVKVQVQEGQGCAVHTTTNSRGGHAVALSLPQGRAPALANGALRVPAVLSGQAVGLRNAKGRPAVAVLLQTAACALSDERAEDGSRAGDVTGDFESGFESAAEATRGGEPRCSQRAVLKADGSFRVLSAFQLPVGLTTAPYRLMVTASLVDSSGFEWPVPRPVGHDLVLSVHVQ
ncbi:hypothetical protein CYMTET_50568, partial [Cymbomonas tetramitiformis]